MIRFLLAAVLILLAALPAAAQKSADTLRIAWRDRIADLDPYYNNLHTGLMLTQQVWDGLIFRDPISFAYKPLLATAWRWVDATTLEFTLRPNVTFHNGDPFTAADVVYTVAAVRDPAAGVAVPGNLDWLAGATAIDAMTVQLKLARPFPAALEYIATVLPIYPQAYRSRVGHAGFSRAPVGSGPYRIAEIDGEWIVLERYGGYYDGGAKGPAAIGHLTIHQVADATAEIDELLQGAADWIWQFNPELYDPIAREAAVTALRQPSMRVALLTLNAAARPGVDNPLADLRVRQAVMAAINRQAFVRQFTLNPAKILDAPCYPSQFGCDQKAALHYAYNPARARALLLAAGRGDGFDIDIVSTGVAPSWGSAIQDDLGAVGIRTRLIDLPPAAALARVERGAAGLFLSAYGSNAINDVAAILPFYFGNGPDDLAGDAVVAAEIGEGGSSVDPAARQGAYTDAIHRISEQAYVLPLSTMVTLYGVSRSLRFTAFADDIPRFFWAKWK